MQEHITQHRAGFDTGWTHITRFDDPGEVTGLGVAVLRLGKGERHSVTFTNEMAWLLMNGTVKVVVNKEIHDFARASLFDDGPCCVHGAKGTTLEIEALSDAEFTVYQCKNEKTFPVEVYLGSEIADEPRGKGQVGGTCQRIVRTIFDDTKSSPDAELVLGEVITMPGRWSSYPPHNHPQPEIYHYRFDNPKGWGHAELGEDVIKIRPNDSMRIVDLKTHAQVAAPGYAMYYAWIIRHLPAKRYSVPDFAPEHSWIMEPGSSCWEPAQRAARETGK